MNIEKIDKWLKEEEGISYTELGNEFNYAVERFNKYAKEYKRLHSITKELRHYIKDTKQDGYRLVWIDKDNNYFESGIEEILDKENKQ